LPALNLQQHCRRCLRLLALPGSVLVALPLAVVSACGGVEWATYTWARITSAFLGLRVVRRGPLPPPGSLVVSNHVGYLDILALGSSVPGRFLAKREIAGWPLLGRMARWGGSVFIDRASARGSRGLLGGVVHTLRLGHRVLLFAEGEVSPDGHTLRPFRPMLFETCLVAGRPIVPVAICYRVPEDPTVWAWIDEPSLWRHLWCRVLHQPYIRVEVRVGEPIHATPGADRKLLAETAQRAVERLLRPVSVAG